MLPDFADIRSRITEEPTWYDGQGTPRYGPFHPEDLGVYDDCALLAEIACQDCGRRFLVGEGSSPMDRVRRDAEYKGATSENPPDHPGPWTFHAGIFLTWWTEKFHYGDPPRHGCVGDTMNSEPLRIVEAWMHASITGLLSTGIRYIRQPDLENVFGEQPS